MRYKLPLPALLLSCGIFLITGAELMAQGKGHGHGKGNGKNKQQQEYTVTNPELVYYDTNGKPDKTYKGKGKDKGKSGYFPHATPHNLNVPPGHYPPAGMYRIWYPGRPPGHQPQPVAYGSPPNAPITDGAFILHSGRAYDTQYDWSKEEAQKPRSVPRQIIDVLFPNNTLPAQ